MVTPESQPTGEEASLYGLSHQLSPSGSSYTRPYQPALPFPLPPSNGQGEHLFPERPDQPECEYYKKTGRCKFGSTCKFHHPSEKIIPKASYFLNPVGLPLRPVRMIIHSFLINISKSNNLIYELVFIHLHTQDFGLIFYYVDLLIWNGVKSFFLFSFICKSSKIKFSAAVRIPCSKRLFGI